jgi:hypothetical protein
MKCQASSRERFLGRSKMERATSPRLLHNQLTPPHLLPCSHKRSEFRYEMPSASGSTQLTIAALLDCPRRETTIFWHGYQAHLHCSYCRSTRFVVLIYLYGASQSSFVLDRHICTVHLRSSSLSGLSSAFFERVANLLHPSGSRPRPLHEGAESLQNPLSESR